jgi:hypothetical protein
MRVVNARGDPEVARRPVDKVALRSLIMGIGWRVAAAKRGVDSAAIARNRCLERGWCRMAA